MGTRSTSLGRAIWLQRQGTVGKLRLFQYCYCWPILLAYYVSNSIVPGTMILELLRAMEKTRQPLCQPTTVPLRFGVQRNLACMLLMLQYPTLLQPDTNYQPIPFTTSLPTPMPTSAPTPTSTPEPTITLHQPQSNTNPWTNIDSNTNPEPTLTPIQPLKQHWLQHQALLQHHL